MAAIFTGAKSGSCVNIKILENSTQLLKFPNVIYPTGILYLPPAVF